MKLIKIVNPYEIIPKFYGVAWYEFSCDRTVCMPLPFNIFARWLRYFYIWMRIGDKKIVLDGKLGYWQGYKDGIDYIRDRLVTKSPQDIGQDHKPNDKE